MKFVFGLLVFFLFVGFLVSVKVSPIAAVVVALIAGAYAARK